MDQIVAVAALVVGALIGFMVAFAWYRQVGKPKVEAAHAMLESELNQKRRQAEIEIETQRKKSDEEREKKDKEAQQLVNQADKKAQRIVLQAEKDADKQQAALAREEGRLLEMEKGLTRSLEKYEQRENNLNRRQSNIDRRDNKLQKAEDEQSEALQKIANMTQEEARQKLIAGAEKEARQDMARVMREVEERAKETAEEQARKVIATAIQRIASDQVAETTTAPVEIPSEEMKGRIIGRNGRNIRAFEQAAGVDIVVDDSPEVVSVSSFDPVRREVARRALAKLVVDGRIHPARIEKVIKDEAKEIEKVIRKAGQDAAYEANVTGLHPEIIKMLGRLKFRTSYGQNQLHHAIETSKIAAMLTAEIGGDIEAAKMGGLLHDLGKAMDHNQEGTHAKLGAEFARRFKVPHKVVNAIESHHHEVDQESVEAIIVESADAISGARPGARRESLEHYIKRVRTLEEIATSYDGVESAYALQAGREIRVLVRPDKVDDLEAIRLSREIAKTIEDSMQYPGQIQVVIIRETRVVSVAK